MRGFKAASLVLILLMLSSVSFAETNNEDSGTSDSQKSHNEATDFGGPTRGELRTPFAFDLLHYDINVTVQPALNYLHGISIITVNITDCAQDLAFDLGLTPSNVSLFNGTALSYDYDFDIAGDYHLLVHPDGHLINQSTVGLVVKYSGTVTNGNVDHIGNEGSWVQRGEFWYPKVHRGDQNASYDRFTADINITVPIGRVVVSNGELVGTRTPSPGNLTFHWRTSDPAKELSFAEGAFNKTAVMHNGISVEVYLFPQHDHLKWSYLDEMNRTLDFYESVFSSYPYPKLALVEIPSEFAYGAACLQSFIVMQTNVFNDFNPADGPLTHEISHNWWGHTVVGLGDGSHWLHEGFASYSADLYGEYQYQNRSRLELQKKTYYQRDYRPVESSSVAGGFSPYNKGPWILHMLRYVLGNATFFQVMNRFATQNAFSVGVVIADFERASEDVSGRNLSWFFQEWLYGTGHLGVEVTNARCLQQRDGTFLTEIKIRRSEDVVMPIDVSFTTVNGRKVVLEKYVNLTSTDMTISFSSGAQTTNVTFDPYGWLLASFAVANITFVPYQRPLVEEPLFWISAVAVALLIIAVVVLVKRRKGRKGTSHQR
jgi:hypothetical protein